jgi:hypothetical protein
MLTTEELATVRAALRYWQEEMCPHGPAGMWPYWDNRRLIALSATEVAALRQQFLAKNVGYAVYDVASRQLQGGVVSRTAAAAKRKAGKNQKVATVLLPPYE